MRRFAAVVIGACVLLATSARSEDKPAPDQSTPKGTLVKMWGAIVQKNRVALKECFTGPAQYTALLDDLYEFAVAAFDFRDALIKAYGADAWEQYQSAKTAKAFVPQIPPRDSRWVEEVVVTVEGDKASYVNPWTKRKEDLVRAGGKWRLVMGESAGPVKLLKALYVEGAKLLRDGAAEAVWGKKTLSELKADLGEKFFAVMNRVMAPPEKDKKK